jgi:hypothetical protein
MAEKVQSMMQKHLQIFTEIMHVLTNNNEKLDAGQLKSMGNDIANQHANIEKCIDEISFDDLNIKE